MQVQRACDPECACMHPPARMHAVPISIDIMYHASRSSALREYISERTSRMRTRLTACLPHPSALQEVIAVRTAVIDEALLQWTKAGIHQVGAGTQPDGG